VEYKSIFITGASSGIGAALAQAYAAPGAILGLAARRADRLQAVAKRCRKLGASVYCYTLDVSDTAATRAVALKFIGVAKRIDLVIANAGVGSWQHPFRAQAEEMTAMINVNVNGVINTISAFALQLEKQELGHIAAISSVAGFRGLPGGVYSASKVAVRYLMEGWRIDLQPHNIHITTVFPGYIASEMTNNVKAWYPFLISAEAAALLIQRAITSRRKILVLPWQWWLILPFLRLVPSRLIGWAVRRRR
jgi:short-subunit dehydrogenase